jgi:hypothetical protein
MIRDTPPELRNIIVGANYYNPTVYKPTPEKRDYDFGYIDRYFVAKINQSELMLETSIRDYNSISANLYKKIAIKWKISGPEYNLYKDKILQTAGVVEYNTRRISDVVKIFPNANIILNNPKQYWRGY